MNLFVELCKKLRNIHIVIEGHDGKGRPEKSDERHQRGLAPGIQPPGCFFFQASG